MKGNGPGYFKNVSTDMACNLSSVLKIEKLAPHKLSRIKVGADIRDHVAPNKAKKSHISGYS